jgi:hypothetical protein
MLVSCAESAAKVVPVCLFEVTEISPPWASNNLGIVASNLHCDRAQSGQAFSICDDSL